MNSEEPMAEPGTCGFCFIEKPRADGLGRVFSETLPVPDCDKHQEDVDAVNEGWRRRQREKAGAQAT